MAISGDVGDRCGTAWALSNLGVDLFAQIELGQADAHSADPVIEEGMAIWDELGERRHLALAQMNLGSTAILQREFAQARIWLEQSLSTLSDLQDVNGIATNVATWSSLFHARGQYEQAVRLLAAT